MDPALWEMVEGDELDEVEAIIRLRDLHDVPAGVRVVARFGEIATCRLRRGDILKVHAAPECLSLKAARLVEADLQLEELDAIPSQEEALESATRRPEGVHETGRGVVIGILDWGCDFAHPDFIDEDGRSRIVALWDQRDQKAADDSQRPSRQNRYGKGTIYSAEEINAALRADDPYQALGYAPAPYSHGTHVMGIVSGNGRGGGPPGVAPEAEIIFVHLAPRGISGLATLGDSVCLLEAVDFVLRTADGRPCVINMSVGRHGAPKDGTTLVERGLDAAVFSSNGVAIVNSCGNYYGRRIHSSGVLTPGRPHTLTVEVDSGATTEHEVEVWYSGLDDLDVEVLPPGHTEGFRVGLGDDRPVIVEGKTVGHVYNRPHDPNNGDNHVDLFLYRTAPTGAWAVLLHPKKVLHGRFNAWIERDTGGPFNQGRFREDQADDTCTVGSICTGMGTLAVGALDSRDPGMAPAPFSSSGPTRDGRQKPNCLAPGVRVLAARSPAIGRDPPPFPYVRMSGTSMAAPHVTGTCALVFEAAGRRLRIEETRSLILSSCRNVVAADSEAAMRIGSGALDVAGAVEAARRERDSVLLQASVTTPSANPFVQSGRSTMSTLDNTLIEVADELASNGNGRRTLAALLETAARRSGHVEALPGIDGPGMSPAAILDAMAWGAGDGSRALEALFEVVAVPGQPLPPSLEEGDLVITRALGEGNFAQVWVVAEGSLLQAEELAAEGLVSAERRAGLYAHAIGVAPVSRGSLDCHATRLAGPDGIVPADRIILRLREAAEHGAAAELAHQSAIEQAERDRAIDEALSATTLAAPSDVLEQRADAQGAAVPAVARPALQHITHAGTYRLAYDRLRGAGYGVIEPLPGRETRRFRGTAALQTALNTWAPYIERVLDPPAYILTGGLYVDKPGEHGRGNAVDIDGFWWSDTNKFMALDAPTNWIRYLTIEATLRKVFGTVLNYDYNRAHHDHWHCDLGSPTGWRAVRSQANFAQRALEQIWGETIDVDGRWGDGSRAAAARHGYDFTVAGGWDRFLDDIINRRSTAGPTVAPPAPTVAPHPQPAVRTLPVDPARWFLTGSEIVTARGGAGNRTLSVYTSGNLVEPLVDGEEMMALLRNDIDAAGNADVIHFTGWRMDSGFELAPSTGPAGASTVANLWQSAIRRGAVSRTLLYRAQAGRNVRENGATANLLRRAGAEAVLDARFPFAGSHHQKSAVVQREGETVAYCGGLDLAGDRWDTRAHNSDPRRKREDWHAWHDVHARVRGPAVVDIDQNFRDRWNDSKWPTFRPPTRPPRRITSPPPPTASRPGTHHVQVLRTYACSSSSYPGFASKGEFSCLAAYRKAIRQARRCIYIEDQYLMWDALATELARALTQVDGLVVVIVVPQRFGEPPPIRTAMNWHQNDFISTVKAAGPNRVHVYDLVQPATGEPIYVHSKVMIVDDIWTVIGSANFNRRSMTHDTELALAVVDAEVVDGVSRFARDLRLNLWGEHLGLARSDPRLVDPVAGVREWERQAALGTQRVRRHVTPLPQRRYATIWRTVDPDGTC